MKHFLKLIEKYINKEINFDRFYSDFRLLYAKEESSQLPENKFAFIDGINEKLFFAAQDPSDEEKEKYNYIDAENFAEWLEEQKQQNISFWSN